MSIALPGVGIQEVERYLQAKNWTCSGRIPSVATVWHRSGRDDAEVVLPDSRSVKDHDQRLQDAIASIASFERRDAAEVACDIAGAPLDLVTVRVSSEDTSEGRIPIDDGILLVSKTRELLYSAAMAVYSKKKQFAGPPSKDAKAYMESLLLGQTEVGSYVVKVVAPNDAAADHVPDAGAEVSFAQLVSHSLIGGLSALAHATSQFHATNSVKGFERAVRDGASANMCDALLGFSGNNRSRSFQVKVSGPTGPLFVRETKVFDFDREKIEALEVASGVYKSNYVLRNREIVGSVRHLHRPQSEETGTVTVEAMVGETERTVLIELGPEDYHLGVQAHDRRLTVRCRGDLHIKNRSAKLLNPSGFRIAGNLQLL